jgi:hypothetical protein
MPIPSMETVTTMRYLLLPFTRRYVTYVREDSSTIGARFGGVLEHRQKVPKSGSFKNEGIHEGPASLGLR